MPLTRRRSHPTDAASLDHQLDAVSRAPRRHVLEALRQKAPRTWAELVELPAWPNSRADTHVRVELHRRHLPYLDTAGFVDWNPETDTVAKGPHFAELDPLLSLLHDHRDDLSDD